MKTYRKKSAVVEALQLRWDTWGEMCDFIGVGKLADGKPEGRQYGEHIGLDIPTPNGVVHAIENDQIIKDEHDIYFRDPDMFEEMYEEVEDENIQPTRK